MVRAATATETRRAFAPLSHARHLDTTRRLRLFSRAPSSGVLGWNVSRVDRERVPRRSDGRDQLAAFRIAENWFLQIYIYIYIYMQASLLAFLISFMGKQILFPTGRIREEKVSRITNRRKDYRETLARYIGATYLSLATFKGTFLSIKVFFHTALCEGIIRETRRLIYATKGLRYG